MILVLRLGHRKNRDARVTTHCGLVARALGADGIILSGERDDKIIESLEKVVEKWGGPFSVSYRRDWKRVMKEYKQKGYTIVHLTMYGEPVQEKIGELRRKDRLLVVVGAEKVPREVYDIADYNIAVGNTPHSEIAALAIFLHEYHEGRELEKKFSNAKLEIEPSPRGKTVRKIGD